MTSFPVRPPDVLPLAGEPAARLRALAVDDWPLEQALSRTSDVPVWTFYPPDLSDDDARRRTERLVARADDGVAFRFVVEVVPDRETANGARGAGVVGIAAPDGTPEVFYAFLQADRGQGLATRAVEALAGRASAQARR